MHAEPSPSGNCFLFLLLPCLFPTQPYAGGEEPGATPAPPFSPALGVGAPLALDGPRTHFVVRSGEQAGLAWWIWVSVSTGIVLSFWERRRDSPCPGRLFPFTCFQRCLVCCLQPRMRPVLPPFILFLKRNLFQPGGGGLGVQPYQEFPVITVGVHSGV